MRFDCITDEQILAIIQAPGGRPGKRLMASTPITREEAWEFLIEKYQGELERRAIEKWPGKQGAVEDALQSVWITVFSNIDGVEGDLKSWLYTCLEHRLKDIKNRGM